MTALARKSSPHLYLARLTEPVPVAPFVAWCDRRQEQLRRSMDVHPAISVRGVTGPRSQVGIGVNYVERLMFELGWDVHNGPRKLNRWRNPSQGDGHSGFADRDEIETSLRCAGVRFEDVYTPWAPSNAWRARLLILSEVVGCLQAVLIETRFCPGCQCSTEAVDECLWCGAETVPAESGT
jgi:hypothetical protein